MVPSNAFLVLWHTSPEPTLTPGDGIAVSLTSYIKPEISIEVMPFYLNLGSLGLGEIICGLKFLLIIQMKEKRKEY